MTPGSIVRTQDQRPCEVETFSGADIIACVLKALTSTPPLMTPTSMQTFRKTTLHYIRSKTTLHYIRSKTTNVLGLGREDRHLALFVRPCPVEGGVHACFDGCHTLRSGPEGKD